MQSSFLAPGLTPPVIPALNSPSYPILFDRTQVTGNIGRAPEVLRHADGSFAVSVQLLQPGGLPVLVELGHGHGAHAEREARQEAESMLVGARFRATGYELRLDCAHETLHLIGCTSITKAEVHRS